MGLGRPKGRKNKSTLEKERVAAEIAARTVMDARVAKKPLAKEVLATFMELFGGVTRHFQPSGSDYVAMKARREAAARGQPPPPFPDNPNADEEQFLRYAQLTVHCAKELAPYQSPTFKNISVPEPEPPMKTIDQDGNNVIDMKDPLMVARIYRRIMTAEE